MGFQEFPCFALAAHDFYENLVYSSFIVYPPVLLFLLNTFPLSTCSEFREIQRVLNQRMNVVQQVVAKRCGKCQWHGTIT